MKTIAILGLIATASTIKVNGIGNDDNFPHYLNGFGGYSVYKRDIPDRFEQATDDLLMRSMYENYATEGKSAGGQPNGHFWVTKENAERAAEEVVETHLHLSGGATTSYIKENFPVAWKRFDVNDEGKVEIDRMPQFLRMVCVRERRLGRLI